MAATDLSKHDSLLRKVWGDEYMYCQPFREWIKRMEDERRGDGYRESDLHDRLRDKNPHNSISSFPFGW